MVLFFLNVRIAGIYFENCTDCTDLKKMYGFFQKNVLIVRIFFSNIVRIVRIFSENVRIFSKKFGHPEII